VVDHRKEPSSFARQSDRQDAVVEEAPGDHILENYLRAKRQEWQEYISHVHPGSRSGISGSIEGNRRFPGTAGVLAGLLTSFFTERAGPVPALFAVHGAHQ
jgi:hypothetical protein